MTGDGLLDNKGSICRIRACAGIAQLVERNLAKVEVASSSLVSRSIFSRSDASQGVASIA